MSRTRIVLFSLGLIAAVGIPAIAMASSSASEGGCCNRQGSCCKTEASFCEQPSATITCPMTGETIKASECPLCESRK